MVVLGLNEDAHPCKQCGGTQFASEPKKHYKHWYELTPEDRIFLRVQRIKPDDGE